MRVIFFSLILFSSVLMFGCGTSTVAEKKQETAGHVETQSVQSKWWTWLHTGDLTCTHNAKINVLDVNDSKVLVNWQQKRYMLSRKETTTGAHRYEDDASGIVFLLLPAKVLLLNKKTGKRLADECNHV